MKKKLPKTKKTTVAKDISVKDLAVTVNHLAGAVDNLSTTVDNLAIMVAKGFDRVDEKFDRIDERFDRMDERFSAFELETKVNFEKTRRDILDVGDRFVPRHEFDNLLVRFNRFEEKMSQKARK